MAEELGFYKRVGNGCAVQGDHGRSCAATLFMEGAGYQFLSRSRFPEHQNRGFRGRNLANALIK